MPYKKSYRKKKYYSRNNNKKVYHVVNNMLNKRAETKWASATENASAISAGAWTINNLTNIAQGDQYNMREADRVRVIGFRYDLHFKCAATDGNNQIRVVLMRSNAGTAPTAGTGLPNVATGWFDSFNSRDSYQCLRDIHVNGLTVTSDTIAAAGTGPGVNCIRKHGFVKFKKPIMVKWDSGTLSRNGLYFCYISDSGAVTHPTVSGYYTLYWKDF